MVDSRCSSKLPSALLALLANSACSHIFVSYLRQGSTPCLRLSFLRNSSQHRLPRYIRGSLLLIVLLVGTNYYDSIFLPLNLPLAHLPHCNILDERKLWLIHYKTGPCIDLWAIIIHSIHMQKSIASSTVNANHWCLLFHSRTIVWSYKDSTVCIKN